jgi:hypothetical protein
MSNGVPGPGVDAAGRPVIDPTLNVKETVEAATKRQDDLRAEESRHIREIVALRAQYDSELRDAEAKRIDAIRAVDIGQVQRAAEVQATQATTLATQVATTADAFRTALTAALEPIQRDIADLRKTQYEQAGQKTQVSETQASGFGQRQWIGLVIAAGAVTASVLLGVTGIVITLLLRK